MIDTMTHFMQLMTYALLGAVTQNVVFTAGVGTGRAIRTAAHPKKILPRAVWVSLFSLIGLCGAVVSRKLLEKLPFLEMISMFPPILFLALAYGVILLAANLIHKRLFISAKEILPGCAFNSIVMMLGTGGSAYAVSMVRIVGFSLGTGVGFLIATLLVEEGIRKIGNPDMNREFLGLPSLLIYIGILAMAFVGFTGGTGFSM